MRTSDELSYSVYLSIYFIRLEIYKISPEGRQQCFLTVRCKTGGRCYPTACSFPNIMYHFFCTIPPQNYEIALDMINGMPEEKKKALRKSLERNWILTSSYIMESGYMVIYKEGFYLILNGTRCSFSVFAYDTACSFPNIMYHFFCTIPPHLIVYPSITSFFLPAHPRWVVWLFFYLFKFLTCISSYNSICN